jgi:hypothetical protein
MQYSREYLIFMIREAVKMIEMGESFNEVGRDEWVWLQQARGVLADDGSNWEGDTMASNSGQAVQDNISSGRRCFTIVVGNPPVKEIVEDKTESIDDIIFAPVLLSND